MTQSRGIRPPRRPWSAVDLVTLDHCYPGYKTEVLAEIFGRTLSQVYNMAAKRGLRKSPEFLASPAAGRTNGGQGAGTRFVKGLTPWNKGISFNPGGRSVEARFKQGQKPKNTLPVGSYRITKDGTLQRKIGEAGGNNSMRWRGVHELVWVEANGPVPPKHIVVFMPGMRTAELAEITLDKVECISLAENMKRNTLHRLPKELAELAQLRGALNRQINKRTKK